MNCILGQQSNENLRVMPSKQTHTLSWSVPTEILCTIEVLVSDENAQINKTLLQHPTAI